jgi:hypothetical protein
VFVQELMNEVLILVDFLGSDAKSLELIDDGILFWIVVFYGESFVSRISNMT